MKPVHITRNLQVDQEFFQFMMNTHSIIINALINFDSDTKINYLAPTDICDKISYLPSDKFKSDSDFDPFGKKIGRVQIKIGRFIQKFISPELIEKLGISKSDIESFVNSYKSWFDKSKFKFEIVEGDRIKDCYNENNYYAPNGNTCGSLWNSCMRYVKRLKFLDLYSQNPNCKMLVMFQQVDDDWLVRARALLWDNVEVTKDFSNSLPSNIKVMDRIYSAFDSDVLSFKKWAFENDYIPKYEQNAKSHQFFDIKGEVVRIRCNIQLDKSKFTYYPYLDTFPYFNYSEAVISNDEYTFSWDYKLIQADGSLERQEQEEETTDEW
jgi:hypothetical protein